MVFLYPDTPKYWILYRGLPNKNSVKGQTIVMCFKLKLKSPAKGPYLD
jgi:hypothetical protein